jgi:hypothetical protein
MHGFIRLQLVCLAVTIALAAGCNTTPSKPTLMANTAKDEISVYQLRALDYEYAAQFGQTVAACVESITATTTEDDVRQHARQWRLWAAPQARFAAFDQDPLAGAIELWVLSAQQHDFFRDGAGKDWFTSEHGCVRRTTEHLEREAEVLAAKVVREDRLIGMTETVRSWAAEHPIEGELFVRPTARADLAEFFVVEGQGALKAVGSLEEVVRDINDRISILAVQMPVEVRWQAEYLVESLFEEQVEGRADSILSAVGDISLFLDDFEGTLSKQTETLVAGIEKERIAVFEAVEEERKMILSAVEEERLTLVTAFEDRVDAATAKVEDMGRGLIDHFFDRLVSLLIVVGVVTFAGVLLVLFIARQMSRRED